MVRRLMVLVLVGIGATVGIRAAYACSCAAPPALKDRIEAAEVMFAGEIVDLRMGDRYDVRVDLVYRGAVPPRVTLSQPYADSTCGRSIEEGPVVYAGDRRLQVLPCGGSVLMTGQAATTYAGNHPNGHPPDPAAPYLGDRGMVGGREVPLLLAGSLLALVGAAYLRRRRNAAARAGGTASAG